MIETHSTRHFESFASVHPAIKQLGPYHRGDILFHRGDTFEALFVICAGAVKSSRVDWSGREQVVGFHLPGEMVGLRALYDRRFLCDGVALDTTFACRLSFPAISALATQQPEVQQHLLRLFSKELGAAAWLAGAHTADQRMAAFLLLLGERYAQSGGSATNFQISMTRTDIGNYLRLVSETVSRVLTRFRARDWIRLDRNQLQLLAPEQLRKIAHRVPCE